ncbi:DNA invertase Pin-like site-specific DNA recombinase [Aquamicrobium ahrensii]|uniref:DNA invertase Pin-like site-specific DNA recombinase n=1 Tax=Aquamicrobium ahrensii TaxID=469551 RepID=A0ABV2KSH6_9HYPH
MLQISSSNVFVLSTFVASQSDEKGRDRRERIVRALEDARRRGADPSPFLAC